MKKITQAGLLLAGAIMITLFSSFIIKGNGNVVSEKRDVGSFNSIDVSNALDVIITQSGACTVEVEADENLQEIILTKVKGGTLYVYCSENIRKAKKTAVYISFEDLEKLEVSGAVDLESAGTITVDDLKVRASGASDLELSLSCGDLKFNVSGASDVDVDGNAANLDINISGASDMDAFQLKAEKVFVDASGASNIKIHALQRLSAESSGASDIIYKGDPEVNRISTSGAGDVRHL